MRPSGATSQSLGSRSRASSTIEVQVRRVSALGRRLAEAARLGFTTALVPAAHAGERITCHGLETLPVATLREAMSAAANLRERSKGARRARLHAITGEG